MASYMPCILSIAIDILYPLHCYSYSETQTKHNLREFLILLHWLLYLCTQQPGAEEPANKVCNFIVCD